MKKTFRSGHEERSGGRRSGKPARPAPRDEAPRLKPNFLYGVMPVLEALRANARRVDKILIAEGVHGPRIAEVLDLARRHGIMAARVPRETLDRQAGASVNHQGILAFAAAADYAAVDDILEAAGPDALLVIADGVEDPQNLGALLRVVECAGADGVIIPDRRAVGLTDSVAKASAGAVEFVKVAKTRNLNRLIEDLKKRNIWIVGSSAEANVDHTEWDWTRPSALVLGGEGKGLHRLVAENCDVLVKIPMYGKISSLNVAAAAGVILFEARRQRSRIKDE